MELQFSYSPSSTATISSASPSPSPLPCPLHAPRSLTFPSSSVFFLRHIPSRREHLSSCFVAKARQNDSKAAPPRKQLWELREYEDSDDEEGVTRRKGERRTFDTEAEEKRHFWVSRMWAPWEEALSPEAQFAVDALNLDQGDEPIVTKEMMDSLNVNEPLIPDAIWDGEEKLPEDPDVIEALENGQVPGTAWKTQMAFRLVPPRDWPPPGWKVDPDELAFIREIHRVRDTDVHSIDVSKAVPADDENEGSFPRWKMFVKQYQEWVAANKKRLDREVEELDEEYYPGRRRMGEEYTEGMYELPFIYPGQHYTGEVTMVHLYEGAFVNIGAVHDGWVPIKRNDWYWIRNHIKVGKRVQVEVIAKRDPYRFRFPIQLRFVHPNIDHLIFNKFEQPPIFVRDDESKNMDLVCRDAQRPFWPRRRPDAPEKEQEGPPRCDHPYTHKVWQLHVAEQMLLDEEDRQAAGIVWPTQELNEVEGVERLYVDADTFWTKEELNNETFDSVVYMQHEWELDMDVARKERQAVKEAREKAKAKDIPYKQPKYRRIVQIEELDKMNWQRYLDHYEAVQRDKVNRLEFGMPLEEPGKYEDDSFFGENQYNPREKRWRHDYVGDVSKSKDDNKRRKGPQVDEDEEEEVSQDDPRIKVPGGGLGGKLVNIAGKSEEEIKKIFDDFIRETMAKDSNEKVVNGIESSRMQGMLRRRDDEEELSEDEKDA